VNSTTQDQVLVYGLSANPIHQAHVDLVVEGAKALAARGYRIARVTIVPVYRRHPVGKRKDDLPDTFAHRLAMCELAGGEIRRRLAREVRRVEVSRIEERLAQASDDPNYTVQTLAALRADYGEETGLILLTGSDLFSGDDPEFGRWYEPVQLIRLAAIAICPRSGYRRNELFLQGLERKGARFICLDELIARDVSATRIRERLDAGEDPLALSREWLLPEPVALYIRQHGLYGRQQATQTPASCPCRPSRP
jgi:nicotinate-nucleotide adenylyltransferase